MSAAESHYLVHAPDLRSTVNTRFIDAFQVNFRHHRCASFQPNWLAFSTTAKTAHQHLHMPCRSSLYIGSSRYVRLAMVDKCQNTTLIFKYHLPIADILIHTQPLAIDGGDTACLMSNKPFICAADLRQLYCAQPGRHRGFLMLQRR
jgi:hypothetical protein